MNLDVYAKNGAHIRYSFDVSLWKKGEHICKTIRLLHICPVTGFPLHPLSSKKCFFKGRPNLLSVIVSQRLVQSRSETNIWTLSMCVCRIWHLLLIVLEVESCPVVYGLHSVYTKTRCCPKWKRYSLASPLRNKLSAEDRSFHKNSQDNTTFSCLRLWTWKQ